MRLLVAAVVAASLNLAAAGADSFTPVRLAVRVAPVARLHQLLRVAITVAADPGVLDTRTGPLRIEVKLASVCGGSFQTTPGVKLVNTGLKPQPATGLGYSGTVKGAGRPSAYGTKTACVYLEEPGDNRIFASDQLVQVNVSRRCTIAAARYDGARKHHTRGAGRDRRTARKVCGPGVPL